MLTEISFLKLKERMFEMGISGDIFDFLKLKFKRKYRSAPSGYCLPDDVAKSLICFSFDPSKGINSASFNSALVCQEIIKTYCPWYWVGIDLAKDLCLTDPPKTIPVKITLPPTGIILLPKNLLTENVWFFGYHIYEPGEKIEVDWQDVDQKHSSASKKTEKRQIIFQYPSNCKVVSWFGVCREGKETFGGSFGLLPLPGELKLLLCLEESSDIEKQVLTLLINCLVFANPVNTDPVEKGSFTKGFGKKAQTFYNSLWIGKGYKRSIKSELGGTHASPRCHYRRGHYRKSRVGAGRKDFKWNWIKPTLINSKNSKEQSANHH